jgi:hypothetical protein
MPRFTGTSLRSRMLPVSMPGSQKCVDEPILMSWYTLQAGDAEPRQSGRSPGCELRTVKVEKGWREGERRRRLDAIQTAYEINAAKYSMASQHRISSSAHHQGFTHRHTSDTPESFLG